MFKVWKLIISLDGVHEQAGWIIHPWFLGLNNIEIIKNEMLNIFRKIYLHYSNATNNVQKRVDGLKITPRTKLALN